MKVRSAAYRIVGLRVCSVQANRQQVHLIAENVLCERFQPGAVGAEENSKSMAVGPGQEVRKLGVKGWLSPPQQRHFLDLIGNWLKNGQPFFLKYRGSKLRGSAPAHFAADVAGVGHLQHKASGTGAKLYRTSQGLLFV